MSRGRDFALLAVVLILLVALAENGVITLLAWTDRVFPIERYRSLFAVYFGGAIALELAGNRGRRALLLALSLVLAGMFSVRFLALSIGWFLLYHRVLYSRIERLWKLGFILLTYAIWAAACNWLWFPGFLTRHPEIATWGYVFAVGYVFRIFWVFHEAGLRDFEPVPLADFLVYFLFGPFFIIVPYMLAIPRPDRFRRSLAAHDPRAVAKGVRTIAYGVAVASATYAFAQLYPAHDAFVALLRDRNAPLALPAGVFWYPCVVLCENIGAAAILIGLCRALGFDLSLPFDRPLLSQSVTEWWRRWNTHFREFLVDLFYYPIVLRLRRRPVAGMLLGCAVVFLIGSTAFHWPKHYFTRGSYHQLPVAIFWENVTMTVLVGASLWREKRGPRRPRPGPLRFAARVLVTITLVFFAVMGMGYRINYDRYLRPIEQISVRLAGARARVAQGHPCEALDLLAPHADTIRDAAAWMPRDRARQQDLALLQTLTKECAP